MSKMDSQYKSFQAVLNTELEKIERAFVHEREELLNVGKKETDTLMEKRRLNEKYIHFTLINTDNTLTANGIQ